jgi:membrane protein
MHVMKNRINKPYYTRHSSIGLHEFRSLTFKLKLLKQIIEYLRFIARRFVEDRCLTVAGSLTYTTLLALVPIFTVTVTLTAHVPQVKKFADQAKTFMLKNLLPDVAGKVITVYMEQFAQNAARLTVIGLVIILATAIMTMFTIDSAFNDIWRTRRQRSWWQRLIAYFALLIIGPLLIGASLSMTSYLVNWVDDLDYAMPIDALLRFVPFAMTAGALILAYRVVPHRHVPMRHALAGGLLAALLFEATKYFFVIYISKVPTYSLVYGAFASVPIFLLWLFCCWMVVLIGAEVTATFSYFRHMDAQRADDNTRVIAAQKILSALRECGANGDENGNATMDFATLRKRAPMPIDQAEDLLDHLLHAGLIVEGGGSTSRGTKRYKINVETDNADSLPKETAIRNALANY